MALLLLLTVLKLKFNFTADYTAFCTFPVLRQRVHIFIVFFFPSISACIFTRFGFQTLLVLLCAWLTLFPAIVPFPHISHLRAIVFLPLTCILV